MVRKALLPKKITRIRREKEEFGGVFVGSLLLGVAADFYFRSWPIGVLVGLGVGFFLLTFLKSFKK